MVPRRAKFKEQNDRRRGGGRGEEAKTRRRRGGEPSAEEIVDILHFAIHTDINDILVVEKMFCECENPPRNESRLTNFRGFAV